MRDRGEWEPDLWSHMGSLPPHIVIIAHCGHCGYRADVAERHWKRVLDTELIVTFRNKLRCTRCRRRGMVSLTIRKKLR